MEYKYLRFFKDIGIGDVPQVGGKNASLGEMFRVLSPKGINLPNGYSTTAESYYYFIDSTGIREKISGILEGLDVADVADLQKRGAEVRQLILDTPLPEDFEQEIRTGYQDLCDTLGYQDVVVAVRSSATAEDLPNASFAGQQETYLNISGVEHVVESARKCIASLFTDRAIVYRVENGFDHMQVALAVGIQQMVAVRSEAAGVMFTLDTETGFRNAVMINSIYGLGENIVQGKVSPDEFIVFKPTKTILKKKMGAKRLKMVPGEDSTTKDIEVSEADQHRYSITDEQVLTLAEWGMAIEEHYGKPMDIEWALDEDFGTLFIVQARPETVQSQKDPNSIEEYKRLEDGEVIITGTSVGSKIATGTAKIIEDLKDIDKFNEGDILVTTMTDPDWVPIMKKSAAIVTNRGGRTCHAAIVSRELGIPCVVGTDKATELINEGDELTVSCNEGDEGKVYRGILKYEVNTTDVTDLKRPKTKIMMNIGSPEHAFQYAQIPNDGVGLAREEFIIDSHIKIHPLALLKFDELTDEGVRGQIHEHTIGYANKADYFVDKLAEGIALIGAAFSPNDVIVRLSDFKSNEYANLIGGHLFEPQENNPMIGWRGASRYYSEEYREAFELECKAFKRVRDEMGLTNVKAMVPFCRTLEEGRKVIEVMESAGLKQGENGFEVYMMVEIPSNVILAEQFAEIFDGFSIGTNDLTQLTLGVDRDSHIVSHVYDENNEAVKEMVRRTIKVGKEKGIKVGLCGQAPSDSPEFAQFLVEEGIDSMSLAPDTIVKTTIMANELEDKR
ncbi:phosphoenolpyruvate synthase [Candidatus Kaiserbacteria bacterium]|nr:phosphoenolpyruvate synthase [Candidatus Kaiserbacteria bacterium]